MLPMATTYPTAISPNPDAITAPRLVGDLAVWFIIMAELLTFGLLFLSYAFARSFDVALFNESQRTLDLNAGAVNTVLLITGSWCVARAVRSVRLDHALAGGRWLLGALLCGGGFVVSKLHEFSGKIDAGIDLSTNTFYMFYIMLTAFHFFHVIFAMVFLAILWFKNRQGAYGSHDHHALETGAAFWHMVDLLWIVLFPLVYVMR